jgi:hypothetical protein
MGVRGAREVVKLPARPTRICWRSGAPPQSGRRFDMRMTGPSLALLVAFASGGALAGEAEISAAQSSIEAQIGAFRAGDDAAAYGYAAPGIKRIFPTLEQFMAMVKGAYQPVWKPKNFAFGKVEELSPTSIAQQVLLVGPDGKDYEAIYTLELQPDGTWRITGVSLRGTTALGA